MLTGTLPSYWSSEYFPLWAELCDMHSCSQVRVCLTPELLGFSSQGIISGLVSSPETDLSCQFSSRREVSIHPASNDTAEYLSHGSLADMCWLLSESESRSVMPDSLQPHGLYSPWNSPGQNTGVSSLSFLQGILPTQGSNPGLPHCRQILYQLSHIFAKLHMSNFQNWLRIWLGMQWIYKYLWKTWHISSTEIVHPKNSVFSHLFKPKLFWQSILIVFIFILFICYSLKKLDMLYPFLVTIEDYILCCKYFLFGYCDHMEIWFKFISLPWAYQYYKITFDTSKSFGVDYIIICISKMGIFPSFPEY